MGISNERWAGFFKPTVHGWDWGPLSFLGRLDLSTTIQENRSHEIIASRLLGCELTFRQRLLENSGDHYSLLTFQVMARPAGNCPEKGLGQTWWAASCSLTGCSNF